MNPPRSDNQANELDQAVTRRLAALRTMPVDTSRLERLLHDRLPRPAAPVRRLPWLQPLRAVAASIAVAAIIAMMFWATAGSPAIASAAEMAQLHQNLVSGQIPVMNVDSIEQASEALSGKWPDAPGLPGVPDSHVMACCMRSIQDRQVACVVFRNGGQPVTMSVAKASDLRSPQSPTLTRDGVNYHVESFGGLNMASAQRDGRWICLMGEIPVDQLLNIAQGLTFAN